MNEKKENVIVNGFFWRFAERCGVQLISAVVSILLARILTPDDYGKVALVTVFNNIMYVLLDCGIGTALVQKKEVDELDYSSAFFFSIVISFVLYGGMFVAAPYLAAFYNDPSMTPIFRGISLTVAYVDEHCFKVSIIPHTQQVTALHDRKVGDIVNLECDIIGKYVEKLLQPAAVEEAMETKKESGITEDFLKKYGF